MSIWRYILAGLIGFVLIGTVTSGIALTMPGAFPIIALFAFWWSSEMTWESEFAYNANRLLKGAK